MLDKNDRKYIIRRIIIYIAIAMIMLLFNSLKVKGLTFTQEVTRHSIFNFTTSRKTIDIRGNSNLSVDYAFDNIINCDTDMCGIEFNYLASYKIESYNSNANTYIATGDIYAMSGLVTDNSNNYNISIVGNSITVIVPKNYRLRDLSLYFSGLTLPNNVVTANMYVEVSPAVTIYNVQGNLAQAIQDNTQAVNNVNNSLNDDSGVSNNDVSGGASDWASNNATSGAINQLVLMPITLLQSFTNGINGSCQTYDFGELWGTHITLPCINLSNTLGSVWTIVDIIMSGIFIFIFGKRCVKIFNDFTNLKSGQIDSLYGGGN